MLGLLNSDTEIKGPVTISAKFECPVESNRPNFSISGAGYRNIPIGEQLHSVIIG